MSITPDLKNMHGNWRLNYAASKTFFRIGLCLHLLVSVDRPHPKMPLNLGKKIWLTDYYIFFMSPNISALMFLCCSLENMLVSI